MLNYRNSSLVVIVLLLSSVIGQDNVFAQTTMYAVPTPNIFFTNIHVDANPIPNKPFTVSADLQSQSVNWSDLIVYINTPNGISVTSPIVSNLAFTAQGNTVRASWTMMASDTGSYPITIVARSNFPPDKQTFALNVNVGTPHSLTLSDMTVPGNLFPNDVFTVGIKLKNIATVQDSNVFAQIYVPSGLQLLDDSTQHAATINSGQEMAFQWKLKAENAGSYTVSFNYTSANAGSNSVSSGVNVGTKPLVTGALLSIISHSTTLRQNSINPIVLDIANNGVQDVHDLQIVSASGNGAYVSTNTPAWIGDLVKGDKKTITLQINTLNGTLPLQLPVSVKYDSDGNSYAETYQTGLQLENQPEFKISTVTVNPSLSYAGDTADKIDVQIFNSGMGTNDVYTTLNLPPGLSPAWGGATSAYFGRIDASQTVLASFYVNVDSKAISGNYPLSMVVTTGQEKTNLNVNFVVAQKALFNLISVDSSQLYPGATNVPIKITLRNDGTSPAQTITTKLLSGNSIPGVKSNTLTTVGNMENIGTILPGQVFTTTFLVDLDPAFTAGDQSSSVEIDWAQNGMNNFVQTVPVPYHIASGPSYLFYYDGIPMAYVILAGIFAVGLAAFFITRKKRLEFMEFASLQQRNMNDISADLPDLEVVEDISAIKDTPVSKMRGILKEASDNDKNKSNEQNKKITR